MKLPIILSTHQELAYLLSKIHPIDVHELEDQILEMEGVDKEVTLSCYIRDYKGPCKVYIRSHDENRGTAKENPHYEIKVTYIGDLLFYGDLEYFDIMDSFSYVLGSGVRFRKDLRYNDIINMNDWENNSLLFRVLMNYILSYPYMNYDNLLKLKNKFAELGELPNNKTITLKDYAVIKFKYDNYNIDGLFLVSIYHRDLQDIPMVEFYSDIDYVIDTFNFVFDGTRNIIIFKAKERR